MQWWRGRTHSPQPRPRDRCHQPLSHGQTLCAYAAMLVFGLPSVLIALVGGEFWPFLDYRMYAEAKPSPEVDWLALVGRTADGAALPLEDERYIVPFGPTEVLRALYTLDVLGERDPTPARRALAGLLTAYEERRRAGEHDGPRLRAVEVYRVRWTPQPGTASPPSTTRTLLHTVAFPQPRQ